MYIDIAIFSREVIHRFHLSELMSWRIEGQSTNRLCHKIVTDSTSLFSKKHGNGLRDIEKLLDSQEFWLSNFGLPDYTDSLSKVQPIYEMTGTGFFLLMFLSTMANKPENTKRSFYSSGVSTYFLFLNSSISFIRVTISFFEFLEVHAHLLV